MLSIGVSNDTVGLFVLTQNMGRVQVAVACDYHPRLPDGFSAGYTRSKAVMGRLGRTPKATKPIRKL